MDIIIITKEETQKPKSQISFLYVCVKKHKNCYKNFLFLYILCKKRDIKIEDKEYFLRYT